MFANRLTNYEYMHQWRHCTTVLCVFLSNHGIDSDEYDNDDDDVKVGHHINGNLIFDSDK